MPTWANDGKIYFSRVDESGGPTTAFRVNPDGTGLEELQTIGSDRKNSLVSYVPSPDGTKAAFQDETILPAVLVVTAANGGDKVKILDPVQTYLGRATANPSWSPDGKVLAVAANIWTDTQFDTGIFIVNADGTGLSVVPGIDAAFDPAWRPN
jgi:Tol biopolymer transport system component